MKIKILKQSQAEIIPVILVTLFFLIFSLALYAMILSGIIDAGISTYVIVSAIFNCTIEFSMATSFFILALYFIYLLIRPSRKCKATLVSKVDTEYQRKSCYLLTFNIVQYNQSKDVTCFVTQDAEVEKNEKYIIKIKDLNSIIKSIEPFDESVKLSRKDEFDLKILLHAFTIATLFMVIIISTKIMYYALEGKIGFIIFSSFFLFGFMLLLITLIKSTFSDKPKEVEN